MIKRYIADKDTTITNAYKLGLRTRATGSNMGGADSLEVFALFNNQSVGSKEKSRILAQFPITEIITARNASEIPASGSVTFYLNFYNVRHHESLPKGATLVVQPVSRSWDEGYGKDLDNYTDPGIGQNGLGTNWVYASSNSSGLTQWSTEGGDYHSEPKFTQTFTEGDEDLRIDITPLVEEWIAGTKDNYGLGIFITSSQEDSSGSVSFYTKKFSGRSSEYFLSRPTIEAAWDSSLKDQRNFFYASSSNASLADNSNTIVFYNYVRGALKNPPTTDLFVRFYTSASGGEEIVSVEPSYPITASSYATGILTASVVLDTSASVVYDRWYLTTSGSDPIFTGEIHINDEYPQMVNTNPDWSLKLRDLKDAYSRREQPRFRLHTRKRNYNPNAYTEFVAEPIVNVAEDVYYRVVRLTDDLEVVGYGTGSTNHTRLSYDASGSYFDFDMSILQAGYAYKFEFAIKENSSYRESHEVFKFRVEEEIGDF